MCSRVCVENVDSFNSEYFAFVVYDLFYKEVKSQTKIGNVGSSYNIDMIIEINNDKVLVEISSSPNHSLYEIDIKKQECQKIIEGAQQISVLDDYIVYKKNTNLYLGKKYEYDFLNMYKCTNNENISISLVNKNDKKYIKIIEHQKNRIEKLKIENYNSLGYYDIEKKVVYKLLDINERKTILNQYEDYVVIGKHYHNPEYCFDSLIVDNEIYKIDYDSDVSLTKIFKTNDSKREYHILEIKENIIKFNVNYYNRAYYEQNKIRYYDLSKSRFLLFVPKVYEEQEENEISIYENIVRFGNENSNYIIEYKVYRRGLMDDGDYAYYFYRVDDGKELCNFYFSDYSNKCDTKFYELFLSNYAPNGNDFKPDHFQIRNY